MLENTQYFMLLDEMMRFLFKALVMLHVTSSSAVPTLRILNDDSNT